LSKNHEFYPKWIRHAPYCVENYFACPLFCIFQVYECMKMPCVIFKEVFWHPGQARSPCVIFKDGSHHTRARDPYS